MWQKIRKPLTRLIRRATPWDRRLSAVVHGAGLYGRRHDLLLRR